MAGGAPATGEGTGRTALLLLGLLVSLNALGIDSYVVALPTMQRAFGVGAAAMQNSVSTYLVGLAAGQAVWGWSSDRFGRRVPLIAALLMFAVGSIGCALSGTLIQLLTSRFLQAFGSAGAGAIAYALVADGWSPDTRPRIYSRLGQIVGGSAIVAPLIGSAILGVAGWRVIFAVLAVTSVLTLVWVVRLVERGRPGSSDGMTAMAGWVALWSSGGFMPGLVASALSTGAMIGMLTASSFVMVNEFGWSSGAYAGYYAATSIGFIAACQINMALLKRMTAGAILTRACATIVVVAAVLVASCLSGRLNWPVYAGLSGLHLGLLGLVLGNAMAVTMTNIPPAIAGRASSVLGIAQFGVSALVASATTAAQPISLSAAITMLVCTAFVVPFVMAARRSIRQHAEAH